MSTSYETVNSIIDSDILQTNGDPCITGPREQSKKRKKKKSKKTISVAATAAASTGILNGEIVEPQLAPPPALCISRNKHWKYISSYHGPWLQLPLELLESLLTLNLDPATFAAVSESKPAQSPSPNPPPPPRTSSRSRGLPAAPVSDVPGPPYHQATLPQLKPSQPMPPPIDPGVFRSVTSIRRLIDEASDLAVRAASGLSAAALGSMRGNSSITYSTNNPWVTAQSLGLNGLGEQGGGGRTVAMSNVRIHRLRALAVGRLAAAYKADEIAASVMVMQGASALDDIAERVLKAEPNSLDARYVQFFHEKIPSRQLAECTTTSILDELINTQPHVLEYYRTRGVVRCFRDEYHLAIRDFTYALKEARSTRKAKHAHATAVAAEDQRADQKRSAKGRRKDHASKANGQAPPSGSSTPTAGAEGPGSPLVHASLLPNAPGALECQLLFHRGAAYLQSAVFLIESAILELEDVKKTVSPDGAELRLCYIENGKFGGVEIANPDGPLGPSGGRKVKAYRERLGPANFREVIAGSLRKSIRDHEKFLSHFDTIAGSPPPDEALKSEPELLDFAFRISESGRPGMSGFPVYPPEAPPASFTTYHPLLVESHFNILLCLTLLGDFVGVLPAFIRAAELIDGLEGYPVFLPARSMAQAEFVEVLERLAGGWKVGLDAGGEGEDEYGRRLRALRKLLVPVIKRQAEKAERGSQVGERKKAAISIPLHGPRVEVILAWLGATHLADMAEELST